MLESSALLLAVEVGAVWYKRWGARVYPRKPLEWCMSLPLARRPTERNQRYEPG